MSTQVVIATSIRTGKTERLTADQAERIKNGPYGRLFTFNEIITPPELEIIPEPAKEIKVKKKNP
jgi:hypothetical protein